MAFEVIALILALFGSLFVALQSVRRPELPEEPNIITYDPRPPEGPKPSPEEHETAVKPARETTIPTVPESDMVQLSWATQKGAYKLTRIMCDEEGLTFAQKEIVCGCVYQESRFMNRYPNGQPVTNANVKDGVTWSTDFGIVQVNDYYHIGPGKTYPSVAYVMDHPGEMVRWMVLTMKRTGKLQPWASFTSGAYKKWLSPGSSMRALKS